MSAPSCPRCVAAIALGDLEGAHDASERAAVGRVHLQAIATREAALCERHAEPPRELGALEARSAKMAAAQCARCKAVRGLAGLARVLGEGACVSEVAGTARGWLVAIAEDARGLCPEHAAPSPLDAAAERERARRVVDVVVARAPGEPPRAHRVGRRAVGVARLVVDSHGAVAARRAKSRVWAGARGRAVARLVALDGLALELERARL